MRGGGAEVRCEHVLEAFEMIPAERSRRPPRNMVGKMTLDEITGGSPYGVTRIAGRRWLVPADRE
jgi:hypothetical protein